jgi:hypothetical protein
MVYQEMSNWCWAACIEMVLRYYGANIPQERIVSEAFGGEYNLPGSLRKILRSLNRKWFVDPDELWLVKADSRTATPATAAEDLANNEPLIIGTLGHAMVLTDIGYRRSWFGGGQVLYALVRDPWPRDPWPPDPWPGRRELDARQWSAIDFGVRIRAQKMITQQPRDHKSKG